ncbi:piggyBac transposable element-derived protein 4-like [Dreissena polymorpha]|uniref:piggyBac transposable element-derived protein 4-like n=1 Tax=Dreissena polymorpha TaxID=45954 RepID=UPI002265471F|nr:piggyBac transposable element-derived protein 4-like [Dreissena polymorpha]
MANRRMNLDDVLNQLWTESDSEDELLDNIDEDDVLEDVLLSASVINEINLEQSVRDKDFPIDTENGWSNVDTPPVVMEFDSHVGLNAEDIPNDIAPLSMFNVLFDESMWQNMVTQTNKYAQSRIQSAHSLKPHSRLTRWVDTTVDEMKVFMSLVLLMGIVRKPSLEDYWSTHENIETPFFNKTMSKNRFLLILSNFHIVDNDSDDKSDRLYKIRPFLQMIIDNFQKYAPERDLSFDEGTCPFKGRVQFRVYNPQKPNKFGMKLFELCEASSGYCVGIDIYHGNTDCATYVETLEDETEDGHVTSHYIDITQTSKIVLGMMARTGTLTKGHHVYMDNYYTSPELYDVLSSYDTYACGTVRINRKEVPKAFGSVKLKQDETIFRRRENLALKYHDKRDVHMLSTIHEAKSVMTNKVNRKTNEPIMKPSAIVDYIQKMGGVDLSDQIVQYYDVLRKCVKWWKKLYFHLFNILVVNAYILHMKYSQQQKKRSHMDFRNTLVTELIESAPNALKPQRKGRKSEHLARLTERHFIGHCKPKPGAKKQKVTRDCIVCNGSSKNREGFKRKQTAYECIQCEKPMCNPECFMRYHTLKYYKPESNQESDSE